MVAVLALGVCAALLVRRLTLLWDKGPGRRGEHWRFGTLAYAAGLIAIPITVHYLVQDVIGVRFEVGTLISLEPSSLRACSCWRSRRLCFPSSPS
jgi:hypothetical protein